MARGRDVTGSRLHDDALAAADRLFRSTLDSLEQAVLLFRPHVHKGRIVDMEVTYVNLAAQRQLSERIAAGVMMDEVFVHPESVLRSASDAWLGRGAQEHTVEYTAAGGGSAAVNHVVRSSRVGDCILQVTVDIISTAQCPVDGSLRIISEHTCDVVTRQDLADLIRQKEHLRWLATHSPLTQLLNQSGFVQEVDQCLRSPGRSYSLIWVELEELDVIRQTFGFAAGDAALTVAAHRLLEMAINLDAIVGQPEDSALAMLVPSDGPIPVWPDGTQEILNELARPCSAVGLSVMTGPVAGVTLAPEQGDDAEALLRRSKTAAWVASRTKVQMLCWRPDLDAHQAHRTALLGEFGRALANDELFFEFQPKFQGAGPHRLAGAEALVRWQHPTKGVIMPTEFIHAVEASGFSRPFTLWVVREAIAEWDLITHVVPGAKVAVNVPVELISEEEFVEDLLTVVNASRTPATRVQIEITERGLNGNISKLHAGLSRLASVGISVALDDFGTGQSSLAFLRRLPIDEVKIDRSFIKHLHADKANQTVVSACVAIARTASMTVCAEGVETRNEMNAATQLGCDTVQGFFTGRPMALEQLLQVAGTSAHPPRRKLVARLRRLRTIPGTSSIP